MREFGVSAFWDVRDINGDSIPDLILLDYQLEGNSHTLSAFSGRDGSRLWSERVGSYVILSFADVNGDGVDDILRLNTERERPPSHSRALLPGLPPQVLSDAALSPDYLVSVDAILGGKGHWQTLVSVPGPSFPCPTNNPCFVQAGDLNGDGSLDLLAGVSTPWIYAIDLQSKSLLWARRHGRWLGWPVVADIDGDSIAEVVVPSGRHGLEVLNGSDGRVKWSFQDNIVCAIVRDLNRDGRAEVIAGSASGDIFVLAGADGRILDSFHANGPIRKLDTADLDDYASLDIVAVAEDRVYALRTWPHAWSWQDGRPLELCPQTRQLLEHGAFLALHNLTKPLLDRLGVEPDAVYDSSLPLAARAAFVLGRDAEARRFVDAWIGRKQEHAPDLQALLLSALLDGRRLPPEYWRVLCRLATLFPPIRRLGSRCPVPAPFAEACKHFQEALERDPLRSFRILNEIARWTAEEDTPWVRVLALRVACRWAGDARSLRLAAESVSGAKASQKPESPLFQPVVWLLAGEGNRARAALSCPEVVACLDTQQRPLPEQLGKVRPHSREGLNCLDPFTWICLRGWARFLASDAAVAEKHLRQLVDVPEVKEDVRTFLRRIERSHRDW